MPKRKIELATLLASLQEQRKQTSALATQAKKIIEEDIRELERKAHRFHAEQAQEIARLQKTPEFLSADMRERLAFLLRCRTKTGVGAENPRTIGAINETLVLGALLKEEYLTSAQIGELTKLKPQPLYSALKRVRERYPEKIEFRQSTAGSGKPIEYRLKEISE